MLLRYAAGSTLGSGAFGAMTVGKEPKLAPAGALKDLGDWTPSAWTDGVLSLGLDTFVFLRLKMPMTYCNCDAEN